MNGMYLWCLAAVVASAPAWIVASRLARGHRLYVRALVFVGTALYVLPVALILAALLLFWLFGIDVVD